MRDNAPELFLDEDLPVIIEYLTERGAIMRDDIAAQKIVDKCLICHDGGRIFLERKSRRDWKETVADMRLLAREELKKDWFTHHESKIIVDLLVKTQGLVPGNNTANAKKAEARVKKTVSNREEKIIQETRSKRTTLWTGNVRNKRPTIL